MAKRERIDTATGAVNSMQNAAKEILPPDHCWLPDSAMPFWKSIVSARAADRWNDTDLEVAVELARAKAKIEKLNQQLEEEGDIIVNLKGTPIENPKHRLLETVVRRMIALSRSLQVHAEATQGKSRDQVPKNKQQQKDRDAMNGIDDDDDLIPNGVTYQ